MARKMTEWPSKRGPITKIMPSDGCIGDTVPLAVGKWYDFHEFGWYMGNVGLNITTASQGLRPAGDFRSSVGLRHAASRRGRKSSHGTTSSILASGSFLASSPAYRCAMSKKPFEGLGTDLDFARRLALESGVQLGGDVGGAEAEHGRALFEADANLGLSRPEVVGQVENARVGLEPALELQRGRFQFAEVVSQQADVDGPAAGTKLGLGVRDGDDVRDVPRQVPPPADDLIQRNVAYLGLHEIDQHRRHVGARFEGVDVLVVLNADIAHQRRPVRLAPGEFGIDPGKRRRHPPHHVFGPPEGRSLGQQDAGLHDVALQVGEGLELEHAAGDHAQGHQKRGEHQTRGEIPPAHRPVDDSPDHVVA